jgi:hypothetical protein
LFFDNDKMYLYDIEEKSHSSIGDLYPNWALKIYTEHKLTVYVSKLLSTGNSCESRDSEYP